MVALIFSHYILTAKPEVEWPFCCNQGANLLKQYATNWKTTSLIVLPLIAATVGVYILVFDLIHKVTVGANIADHQRTSEIVNSAFHATEAQLANFTTDNAVWDEAAIKIYETVDQEWFSGTFGDSSSDGSNYNSVFAVDRSNAQSLAGFRNGLVFNPNLNTYFMGNLDGLLDLVGADIKSPKSKTIIAKTQDGMAIIAAGTIAPTSVDLEINSKLPRYLIFVRYLTPEYIKKIGDQYVIGNLALIDTKAGIPKESDFISNATGTIVANIKWKDRNPGDDVGVGVFKNASLALSFLALVMVGIGLSCLKLISSLKRKESDARTLATRDSLTGLLNRAALQEKLSKIAFENSPPTSIVFADLDGFKDINDTYDHETGDRLLKQVAAGLVHLVNGEGSVYRLGGDEFVALFVGPVSAERAVRFANDFIKFLNEPFDLDGRQADVGVSIGIAGWTNQHLEGKELLRRADVAMYQAKAQGKNCVSEYTSNFDVSRVENLAIAEELRGIISSATLEVAYQPIVDARTSKIIGVEALARWPSSSARKLTPDRFIGIAESNGLIDDLGNFILSKACQDASAWPDLKVSVNVSTLQLKNPNFVKRTLEIIASHGINPERIEIEITESTLLEDIEQAKKILAELQKAGVRIALDDFGTGFSGVGYLQRLNFDRIKIDRSMINQITIDPGQQKIVQGMLLMAKGLATAVTAEGVENEEQISLLKLMGCFEMQGFFYFKPMSSENITLHIADVEPFETFKIGAAS
jgi:diguanylate cyclase (GGDEF)-like protein